MITGLLMPEMQMRILARLTVWMYVNTAKEVGDVDHLKVFASEEAAERWLAEERPEGVAFEYSIQGLSSSWLAKHRGRPRGKMSAS